MYLPPWKGCNVYDLERRDTLGYGYDHRGFTKEEILQIELREQEKVVCLCECRCDSSIAVPNNGTFKGKTTGNNSPLIISNGDVNINFE